MIVTIPISSVEVMARRISVVNKHAYLREGSVSHVSALSSFTDKGMYEKPWNLICFQDRDTCSPNSHSKITFGLAIEGFNEIEVTIS